MSSRHRRRESSTTRSQQYRHEPPQKAPEKDPILDAAELDEAIQAHLAELEHKVKDVYPRKIECLMQLQDAIAEPEAKGCFDSEDGGWIDSELTRLAKELSDLEADFSRKSRLYHETLAEMTHMLETRQAILNRINESSGFFEHQPELTRQFAQKQAELVAQSNMLRSQIFDPAATRFPDLAK